MTDKVWVATGPGDVEAVQRLRYDVYVEEMHTFRSVADHQRRLLPDPDDAGSRLLVAARDGAVAGTLRLTFGRDGPFGRDVREIYRLAEFDGVAAPEQMLVFGRFIVAAAHRRGPVPGRLIEAATRMAYAEGVELAFCDCSPHLVRFYRALGFRPYCGAYNDPELALQVPMVMVTRDLAHLRRVGSPVAALHPPGPWPLDVADRAMALLDRRPGAGCRPATRDDLGEPLPAFLAGLGDTDLARLVAGSHVLQVEPGTHLIRRDQVLRTMFLVLGGTLEAGRRHVVGRGEVVGDLAFLLDAARTRDVVAGPDGATVLSLHEPTMRRLLGPGGNPAVLQALCTTLARRLADA